MTDDWPPTSRRSFLRTVGAGLPLLAATTSASGKQVTATSRDRHVADGPFAIDHPTGVLDRFLNVSAATPYLLGRSGWEAVSVAQQVRTIRRLHAGKLDLHSDLGGWVHPPSAVASGVATAEGLLAEDVALPAAGQQHLNVRVDGFDRWYDRLEEEERWPGLDGRLESSTEFLSRRFDGGTKENAFGESVVSPFYGPYRDHLARSAITFIEHGYA